MKTVNKFYKGDFIFTNGAFLSPVKVTINGVQQWRWIVSSFEDDSFLDGKMVNPVESANNLKRILEKC